MGQSITGDIQDQHLRLLIISHKENPGGQDSLDPPLPPGVPAPIPNLACACAMLAHKILKDVEIEMKSIGCLLPNSNPISSAPWKTQDILRLKMEALHGQHYLLFQNYRKRSR